MRTLTDRQGRRFTYIRLSLTEACNFRCHYCLPNGYQKPTNAPDPLSVQEIRRLVQAFVELGVHKFRLTGGEPTLRRDFFEIAQEISKIPEVRKLALTTNGFLLQRRAERMRQAGITALNISIDSLDPDKFQAITGRSLLKDILAGVDTALSLDFETIKINTVLMRHETDSELQRFMQWVRNRPVSVRFIELMPTVGREDYFHSRHLRAQHLRDQLIAAGWNAQSRAPDDGPARVYEHPDYLGTIGFIAPYDQHFCDSCNRLRISSYGALRLCLFGDGDYSLRHLLEADQQKIELINEISQVLQLKKDTHALQDGNRGDNHGFSAIGG